MLQSGSCNSRGHARIEITIKGEFNTRVEIMLELRLYQSRVLNATTKVEF